MKNRFTRFLSSPIIWCVGAWLCLIPVDAFAQVFQTKNGGKFHGKWLNENEKSPTEYEIETDDGMIVRIPVAGTKITPLKDVEKKYLEKAEKSKDDLATHEGFVEACMDKSLISLAKAHRERILDLDPENKIQREVLNYVYTDRDGWIYEDKYFARMGMVRHKSDWKFPEEVMIADRIKSDKEATIKAGKELGRYIQDASQDGKRSMQAMIALRSLNDPYTTPKIRELLLNGKETVVSPAIRQTLVEALIRIKTPDALSILLELRLQGRGELETIAFQEATKINRPFAINFYLAALVRSNADGPMIDVINEAGVALGELGDAQAIKPLIKFLTAKRTKLVSPGGQTNVSASGGFSTGGKPQYEESIIQLKGVLSGLQAITGANFQYNQAEWERWYANEYSRTHLPLQRDP